MSRVQDALKRAVQERSRHHQMGMEIELPAAASASGVASPTSAVDKTPVHPPPGGSGADAIDFRDMVRHCIPTAWQPDTSTMLFFSPEEEISNTEQFRTLRSRFYQMRGKKPLRKVLVTSALPREGRSFIAANLAQVMACQSGCRTLLIDADLRTPRLHRDLGTTSTPGLSEYLLGETEGVGIIQRGAMENLFFIPSGRPVSAQTEVVANGRLKHLIGGLESHFEWIVVDSPAALPVSDSGLIANFCDGVLMVVRSGVTPFDVVRTALRKFPAERIVGVVLNEIPADKSLQIQV